MEFFKDIDFNKPWSEDDWEKFFQAQDDYRISVQSTFVNKTPLSKFKFVGPDEVKAFEPVMRAYNFTSDPAVMAQLRDLPFVGDQNPEDDYHPATDEDPHYWGEGAPLTTVLIYRDACRFAICTSQEIDRHLKRRDLNYKRKFTAELESLRFHANWIAINVGQGHRIGYSEERVRGNIAKCRRAIQHTEICISLLNKISQRTRAHVLRVDLFSFAVQLRNGLHAWVDELRTRVSV